MRAIEVVFLILDPVGGLLTCTHGVRRLRQSLPNRKSSLMAWTTAGYAARTS